MEILSNSKQYNYAISNYDKYNLGLQSEYEMMSLLNKLEGHGETLDSLHECNYNEFCDMVFDNCRNFTDAEIAEGVMECNAFFTSKEQYLEWTNETTEDLKFLSEMWDNQLKNGSIVKTTDGYVELCIV